MVQKLWNKLLVIFSAGQGQAKKPGFSSLRGGNRKTLHGLIIIMVGLLTSINVNAVTCSNGTIQGSYTINNSSWTNFTNNFNTGNNTIYAIRLNLTNSNIKNNSLWYAGTINLESTINGYVATNPNIVFRYGTSSNFIDVTSNCSIQQKRNNYGENFDTKWEIKFTCSYTGNNTNANWLQIYIYGPNQDINIGSYKDICLQINPNSTDQIINNDNQNKNEIQQQIYEDYLSLWEKGDEIEEVIRSEIAGISESLEVTAHEEFELDNTEAEELETQEGILKNNLLSPFENGNIQNYVNINPNNQEYQNGMTWFWSIIDRAIGPQSVIWILTSIILSLGLIKLILSR